MCAVDKSATSQESPFEMTKEFAYALDILQHTNDNIYISGVAGTGKSTLLDQFRQKTSKEVVLLAPTGISALLIGGSTIHSFFRFPIRLLEYEDKGITYRSDRADIYRKVETIVIDEISMVRADLLDAIDYSLRKHRRSKKPFGGVQMVFFGDIMQLPPVVAEQKVQEYLMREYGGPFFFNSKVFVQTQFDYVELTKVFRQKDPRFISLLEKVRYNTIDYRGIEELNQRYLSKEDCDDEGTITLCATNKVSSEINTARMNALKTKPYTYVATIEGKFDTKMYPVDPELTLKEGAQVMMVRSDANKNWVNGQIGKVISLKESSIVVEIDGTEYDVGKSTWEMIDYVSVVGSTKLEAKIIGTFTQYPIVPAWAITIHKSQGKTFDKVNIDLGNGAFSHGQTYVALSRCRSLENIHLRTKIRRRDIIVDPVILAFVHESRLSMNERTAYRDGNLL